jgi:hypothetical protein
MTAAQPGDEATPTAARIEATILAMLAARKPTATLCPSEVARALAGGQGDWRPWMPCVRRVAQALAQARRIAITRGGVPVDAVDGGGPIRLGWPRTS